MYSYRLHRVRFSMKGKIKNFKLHVKIIMHKSCYCFTPQSCDVFTQTFRVIAVAINKDKIKFLIDLT